MTVPTIIMPPLPEEQSDEADRAYNAECSSLVREALEARVRDGEEPLVRTRYPNAPEDGSADDLLTLDEGEVVPA